MRAIEWTSSVLAGEQRNQKLLDNVLLADDDFFELSIDGHPAVADLLDGLLFEFIRIKIGCHEISSVPVSE
jgi:hypothetical protein